MTLFLSLPVDSTKAPEVSFLNSGFRINTLPRGNGGNPDREKTKRTQNITPTEQSSVGWIETERTELIVSYRERRFTTTLRLLVCMLIVSVPLCLMCIGFDWIRSDCRPLDTIVSREELFVFVVVVVQTTSWPLLAAKADIQCWDTFLPTLPLPIDCSYTLAGTFSNVRRQILIDSIGATKV